MRQEFDSPYPHGIIFSASLAQLVEQLPLKEMVGGSNPSRGTLYSYLWKKLFYWTRMIMKQELKKK